MTEYHSLVLGCQPSLILNEFVSYKIVTVIIFSPIN